MHERIRGAKDTKRISISLVIDNLSTPCKKNTKQIHKLNIENPTKTGALEDYSDPVPLVNVSIELCERITMRQRLCYW